MDININEKQLSNFRKYYLEFSIFVLASVLALTVMFVVNLNTKFTGYILEDKLHTAVQLDKSIEAINNNTKALYEFQAHTKQ